MIYISDEKKIEKIRNKINKDNMIIFLDFDRTITSNESQDSWAAITNEKVTGKAIIVDMDRYYEIYRPIELDNTMNIEEKEKYIIEWYDKCMDLYYKYNLTKEKIEKCIKNSKIELRKGAKDFLIKLSDNNIPVIILSAGIGNVIEQFLKEQKCYFNNMQIISNFIKFDKNGKMIKFQDNMTHSLNKDIDKLADLKIKKKIEEKEYRIVIGDLVEDIKMKGIYDDNKSLKIGFLNNNVNENLEIFLKNFDIVLTEENNFYDIEKYLFIN